jgi:hypothetical protein
MVAAAHEAARYCTRLVVLDRFSAEARLQSIKFFPSNDSRRGNMCGVDFRQAVRRQIVLDE